jgi:hypothetical protein
MELQLPLPDRMHKEGEKEGACDAREPATLYRAADAFRGERRYNHSIQPAQQPPRLLLEDTSSDRPQRVLFTQGSFGGVRAAMQLRADAG